MSSFHNLETLTASDQLLFNKYGKGPNVEVPFEFVQQAIENFVDKQPQAIAAEHNGTAITYQELEDASNLLANRLIRNGLRPRQRVCLVVQRSISMVIAVLAVLKCGCQYVPLDGGIAPDDTLRHVLKDTDAKYILCLSKFQHRVVPFATADCSIIVLDGPEERREHDSAERPSVDIAPTDGAYMIYTSGTTGRPKGVDVSHRGATNLLCLYPGNLGIKPGTNVAQCLSISFDMGQWEILSTLMNGGTLLLRTSDWVATLKRVHTVISTPSILQKYRKADFPNIRVAVVGGEPCPKLLANEWSNGGLFINCCGPTEVSILNTMLEYDPARTLSIGSPVPNTNVYILDEDENPVPIGETGYMWAGGACVTRGYRNLPELTSKRYKEDKFTRDGSKMFNTGDLVRWLDDGNLEHRGRGDDQVKIKGFRVELDSISSTIEKTQGITKACAIFQENILWAFYSGALVEEHVVRDIVAKHQPYYAIPSRWEHRSILPLTMNGKIDKRALMASVQKVKSTTLVQVTEIQQPFRGDIEKLISFSTSERSSSSISSSVFPEKDGITVTVEAVSDKTPQYDIINVYPLPAKKGIHGLRALRYRVLNLYGRFFTIATLANIATMIWILSTRSTSSMLDKFALATAANLTVAVLMRQDHVVNALFRVFCSVPTSAPFLIRRSFARIFHIGGIHSGTAIASTLWFMIFTISITAQGDSAKLAVTCISWLILILLLAIVATAHPTFRKRFHDQFELIHRFAGWTALSLFWMQTILFADSTRGSLSLASAIVDSPGFWLLLIATSSIILPWLTLRRVPCRSDVLSPHAVRVYFDYCTPVPGAGVRLSHSPLKEWHAFAAIPKPNEKGFSLLVSAAGDWTNALIASPPTSIYIRGVPACGVLRMLTLFKSVVLVATGSGIGPCLPHIYARALPMRILWSTPNPKKTFGTEVLEAIYKADEKAIVHDTKAKGRPDLVALAYALCKESGAEAVCVISNQKVTQLVVYGMESRGVAAFGAVFDS